MLRHAIGANLPDSSVSSYDLGESAVPTEGTITVPAGMTRPRRAYETSRSAATDPCISSASIRRRISSTRPCSSGSASFQSATYRR